MASDESGEWAALGLVSGIGLAAVLVLRSVLDPAFTVSPGALAGWIILFTMIGALLDASRGEHSADGGESDG